MSRKRQHHIQDSSGDEAETSEAGAKRFRSVSQTLSPQRSTSIDNGRRKVSSSSRGGATGTAGNDDDDEEEDQEQASEDELASEIEGDRETNEDVNEFLEANRSWSNGQAATSGVIERVELVNFMCHKRLTVPLGPQLNFIIGHNGSGKSAVLTGIAIALGGKAASTSRGNSLKSFVKEGCNAAEVTLWIRNQGPEAFKRSVYGDRILIERRINADGGGHWRMKSSTGKIISTKRQELNEFTDHANIQVDNPMNVLTQDAARQFLSSSNSGEMYDFFLRGTQLKQLAEEYELIKANIGRMTRTVHKKEEALPDLARSAQEAAAKVQLMKKQKGLKNKLTRLNYQLVWAQMVEKEKSIEKVSEMADRVRSKIKKIEADLERVIGLKDEASERIQSLEAQSKDDSDRIGPLEEERGKIKVEMRELKQQTSRIREEERQQSDQYSRLDNSMQDLHKRIETETAKLAGKNQEAHNEMEARRQELEETRRQCVEEEANVRDSLRSAEPYIKDLGIQEARASENRDRLRSELERVDELQRRLAAASKNSIEAFGQGIPELLRSINRDARFHRKPVGPIGAHLKLKDAKWAPVLESVIGNTLNAFCVVDHHDRRVLEDIKRRQGMGSAIPILTGADENFDFSHGEPAPEVTTILRVLQIDDSYILHQLVNAVHIESCALVEKRVQGDELMRRGLRNVRSCMSADLYRIQGGTVGSTTQTLNPYTGPPRLSSDVQAKLAQARQEYERIQQDLKAANEELKQVQGKRRQAEEDMRSSRQKLVQLQKRQQKARDEIVRLDEEVRADEPASIAALEEARREVRDELDRCKERFAGIQGKKEEVEAQMRPKSQRYEEIRQLIDSAQEEAGSLKHRLEKAVYDRLQQQTTEKARMESMKNHREQLKAMEADLEDRQLDLKESLVEAFQYTDGERVEANRSREHYEGEIKAVEDLIKAAHVHDGGNIDEAEVESLQRLKAYDGAKNEIDAIKSAIKAMGHAIDARMQMWEKFRRFISYTAKNSFAFHLNNRGYTGSLQFNHDAEKLTIKVQTDDLRDGGGGGHRGGQRNKDPKSLSGGEKSFSTICLLLSLWEAIGCPIRCLDEFDVFMDAVNRKVSMRMMVDMSKTASHVQFVLITPQNMANTNFGPEVNIQRLSDPERGQGVLNFGSGAGAA